MLHIGSAEPYVIAAHGTQFRILQRTTYAIFDLPLQ